jgi:hypothetical protein
MARLSSKSTEVAQAWSGMLIGMYACVNGTACTRPADFDWYELRSGKTVYQSF